MMHHPDVVNIAQITLKSIKPRKYILNRRTRRFFWSFHGSLWRVFFMYTLAVIMMACLFVHKRIDTVVTYVDIRAKRAEILKAEQEYIQRLRDTAKRLVSVYEDSLELPASQWRDINGKERPYVYILWNGHNTKPEDLRVELQDGVAFDLWTVVDDNPRQSASVKVAVKIVLLDGDNITISVNGYQVRTFSHVDSYAKFNEVCEFIKDSILMSMNDVKFGKASLPETED